MQEFNNIEDYEKWLNEFEFLRNNTTLSSLGEAKLKYMRNNRTNQRNIDEYEYINRFRVWKKLCEEEWKNSNQDVSLHEYAYNSMVEKMSQSNGLV